MRLNLALRPSRIIFMMIVRLGIGLVGIGFVGHAQEQTHRDAVYWGDLHVHSSYSLDAYLRGTRASPDEIYSAVQASDRPMDFILVADHSEAYGYAGYIGSESDERLLPAEVGLSAKIDRLSRNGNVGWQALYLDLKSETISTRYEKAVTWTDFIATADRYNSPGNFTTLVGYEWSSARIEPVYGAIHRVVLFDRPGGLPKDYVPFSSNMGGEPVELWGHLQSLTHDNSVGAITIPHNGNLSRGQMFALPNGESDLARRHRIFRPVFEPLVEITQLKGDSETSPYLSKDDQFAKFERWYGVAGNSTPSEQEFEYARQALMLGLQSQAAHGLNALKFGFVGGSDAHNGAPNMSEQYFSGKFPDSWPSPERALSRESGRLSASGITAVWAEENTRESLFAAMKRREVYASTGPRIELRFFGGWEYGADAAYRPNLARIGYEGGVPMGGDLSSAPDGKAPRFLIRAVKDPLGANLDRVQVIKGWLDEDGETHERVYDVALSDGRCACAGSKALPVGSTVDIADASYTNTIGDPELAVVWEDPDFDASEPAFYYVRVLEIPTPRWTAYDAKAFDIPLEDIPADVPMTLQERAYSSPIWYTP